MIREDKFIQARQPYAVDLGSLHVAAPSIDGKPHVWARVDAVWFRRRRPRGGGEVLTVACLGQLRDLQDKPPADAAEFLAALTDGRYGGDCWARWDGTELWAQGVSEQTRAGFLAVLRPMLENYPAIPEGYEGWHTFHA